MSEPKTKAMGEDFDGISDALEAAALPPIRLEAGEAPARPGMPDATLQPPLWTGSPEVAETYTFEHGYQNVIVTDAEGENPTALCICHVQGEVFLAQNLTGFLPTDSEDLDGGEVNFHLHNVEWLAFREVAKAKVATVRAWAIAAAEAEHPPDEIQGVEAAVAAVEKALKAWRGHDVRQWLPATQWAP